MSEAAPRFDLAAHTIFAALAGSHAHGTAREGSDVDVRGVCVAPIAVRASLFARFEQHEGPVDGTLAALVRPALAAHPTARGALGGKVEGVVFDLAKFLSLAAVANPSALELLFTDEADWLHASSAWRRVHAERARFLTKHVEATFLGYAMQQLHRIETHRAWVLAPPPRAPTRADFGLPDASTLSADDRDRVERALAERLESYGIAGLEMPRATRIELTDRLARLLSDALSVPSADLEARMRAVASGALGLPVPVVQALNAERRYRAAWKSWQAFEAWRTERNPARAELERRHGYDTKHAMHLVRLMRMGIEALREGVLRVRRPDAHELGAIRDGALQFDELRALAQRLRAEMDEAARRSSLPDEVDTAWVDALALELIGARPYA